MVPLLESIILRGMEREQTRPLYILMAEDGAMAMIILQLLMTATTELSLI